MSTKKFRKLFLVAAIGIGVFAYQAARAAQVDLAWDAATDNVGVVGYNVFRSAVSGGPYGGQIATTGNLAYSDTTVANSTTYYYVVQAYDAAGNVSPYSNEIDATTPSAGDTTPPTVSLSAPADGAIVSGNTPVVADALDNVAVAGVQFKLDGNNLGAEDTTSPYSISWDTTAAADGSHVLSATVRDTSSNQANSPPITVTVNNGGGPPDTTAPSIPSSFIATAISESVIDLTWGASTDNVGVTGYNVYRSLNPGGPYLGIASTTNASFLNTGLNPNTRYYYVVSAYDAVFNTSGDSSEADAQTFAGGSTAAISQVPTAPPLSDAGDNGLLEVGTNLGIVPDSGGLCPRGMVWVPAPGRFCIDRYENSDQGGGVAASLANQPPWVSVPLSDTAASMDAARACQAGGNRLPTSDEWFLAALVTPVPDPLVPPPGSCAVTGGSAVPTGSSFLCRSIFGVYDMIGNVAEWTNDGGTGESHGGSFQDGANAARNYEVPRGATFTSPELGFRCVRQ